MIFLLCWYSEWYKSDQTQDERHERIRVVRPRFVPRAESPRGHHTVHTDEAAQQPAVRGLAVEPEHVLVGPWRHDQAPDEHQAEDLPRTRRVARAGRASQ